MIEALPGEGRDPDSTPLFPPSESHRECGGAHDGIEIRGLSLCGMFWK